jgi:predicted transcriptional regulator
VYRLEKGEREMSLQMLEHGDSRDQDGRLVSHLANAEKECTQLSEELARLRDVERRCQEAQQSQQSLQSRVDELEQSDSAVADAVEKERRGYETKLRRLERDLQASCSVFGETNFTKIRVDSW